MCLRRNVNSIGVIAERRQYGERLKTARSETVWQNRNWLAEKQDPNAFCNCDSGFLLLIVRSNEVCRAHLVPGAQAGVERSGHCQLHIGSADTRCDDNDDEGMFMARQRDPFSFATCLVSISQKHVYRLVTNKFGVVCWHSRLYEQRQSMRNAQMWGLIGSCAPKAENDRSILFGTPGG